VLSSHIPSIPFPTLGIAPVYQSKTTKSWTPELVFRSVSAEIPLQSWEGWTIRIALFHVNSKLPAKECEYTGALDMNPETPEVFLFLTPRRILELARAGKLPAHPIGDGARRVWRFRLSKLAAAVTTAEKSAFTSRAKPIMVRDQAVPGRVAN
jgi:hypothetical protein